VGYTSVETPVVEFLPFGPIGPIIIEVADLSVVDGFFLKLDTLEVILKQGRTI